jgi:hypothetical protein
MNQLEKTIDDAIKYWADENNDNADYITNMILKCDAEFFGELYRIVSEKLGEK